MGLALFSFAILVLTAWFGFDAVKREEKQTIKDQLQTTLSANIQLLRYGVRDRILMAESFVANPQVRRNILSLIHKLSARQLSRVEILAASELTELRSLLGVVSRHYRYVGFVVADSNGQQIASMLNEPVGRSDLILAPNIVSRSLKGESVLSHPFPGEDPLPDAQGKFVPGQPTILIATPVRNEKENIVGVFSFRLRPEEWLGQIMTIGRTGRTGETYAFDSSGTLLTESRFLRQLYSVGLLDRERHPSSILNLQIRDPGVNMVKGGRPAMPRRQQPLTYMAARAVNKNPGVNVDGYNDYRGVPVVGAWTWLPDLDLGIATEMDVSEAFAPLHALNGLFFLIFGLLAMAVTGALVLRYRQLQSSDSYVRSQLRAQENITWMQTILDRLEDGIIMIDRGGMIEVFNRGAEKIFGYRAEEVIGVHVNRLLPEPHSSKLEEYLKRFMATEPSRAEVLQEINGRKKDGMEVPLEVTVSTVKLGTRLMFTGILRDITRRKHGEMELERAKETEKRANQAKSEFLSRMSHELRTPLNAILGFAQLLDGDRKDLPKQSQRDSVRQILKAGQHLLKLIDEVLDLSRIEAGKVQLFLEPVAFDPVVREVFSLLNPLAEKYQVHLINQVAGVPDTEILADPARLKQVLLNLVSNGIKYNRKNGTVTVICQSSLLNRVRLGVKNTGPGINPDRIDSLFEPFNRLGIAASNAEGTGIGLSISRRLMEMMGGTLSFENYPGEGCCFWTDLIRGAKADPSPEDPRADPGATPRAPDSPEPLPAPRNYTVL